MKYRKLDEKGERKRERDKNLDVERQSEKREEKASVRFGENGRKIERVKMAEAVG